MAACCGRGVGEDGEAEMPPLVFAMAEMEVSDCSGFQRFFSWCLGESFELLDFRGLNRNEV